MVCMVRILDRRTLWHGDQPREHVLVRWSDGTDSPTWKPLEVIKCRFPNVFLEDKDVAIREGVDTVPQPRPQTQVEQQGNKGKSPMEEHAALKRQSSRATSKPKRNAKPPNKFGDCLQIGA